MMLYIGEGSRRARARFESRVDRALRKAVTGILCCTLALADILFPAPVFADAIMGISAGRMSIDVPSKSSPKNIALLLGWEIDSRLANLSLMGEINRTLSHGTTRQNADLEFESNGIYLIYKSNRPVYVTLRGGAVWNEIITGDTSSKDEGFAFGGGIGVVSGRARIIIEYTNIAGDADFLSLGLEF